MFWDNSLRCPLSLVWASAWFPSGCVQPGSSDVRYVQLLTPVQQEESIRTSGVSLVVIVGTFWTSKPASQKASQRSQRISSFWLKVRLTHTRYAEEVPSPEADNQWGRASPAWFYLLKGHGMISILTLSDIYQISSFNLLNLSKGTLLRINSLSVVEFKITDLRRDYNFFDYQWNRN